MKNKGKLTFLIIILLCTFGLYLFGCFPSDNQATSGKYTPDPAFGTTTFSTGTSTGTETGTSTGTETGTATGTETGTATGVSLIGEDCSNPYSLLVGSNSIGSYYGDTVEVLTGGDTYCYTGTLGYSPSGDTVFSIDFTATGTYNIEINKSTNNRLTMVLQSSCSVGGPQLGCDTDWSPTSLSMPVNITSIGTYYLIIFNQYASQNWPDSAFTYVNIF